MRFHPLASDVKCPACGAGLTFLRVRRYGDLYQCSDGPCRREVLHYRSKGTKACGYALAYGSGLFGAWTACDVPAAEKG
jgi:ssDNA-binding Zn-finger/Zn-ribbon topoisomerase 1